MAEVFVATDLVLGRLVAVKRLPSAMIADQRARARFDREGRALAQVNDPNVVTVFDAIEDQGRPFLVMELVDGITLREALDRETGLPTTQALAVASGIASGLAAVHAHGVVHRDLKPGNVFLTTSGGIKIGDFGIALITSDPSLTRTGEVFGSAPYIAPEQLRGGPVDARADLYALGCVLFEMLAGRGPFEGDDPMALSYHHVHTEPSRIESLVPEVHNALGSIVHGLLAKDPNDRPQTAAGVGRALAAVAGAASDAAVDGPGATAPTEPLPRTPTAPLPPRRSDARRPQMRLAPLVPWATLVAIGAAVLIAVGAVLGSHPVAAPTRPSTRASSGPAFAVPSASPTSPAISPPTSVPASPPSEAALALMSLVQEMESADLLDGHLAKDLEHETEAMLKELDRGDVERASEHVAHLNEALASAADRGEVSPEDAQRLQDAVDRLASSIGTLGLGDHGEGGDNGD